MGKEGTKSLRSDHKGIKVSFGKSEQVTQTWKQEDKLGFSEPQLKAISSRIEDIVAAGAGREWIYRVFSETRAKSLLRKLRIAQKKG